MVANGQNEQFNTNLGNIQHYLDPTSIPFVNRGDKEEKNKNRVPCCRKTWPDPEKPMPDQDSVTSIYPESGLKHFALLKKSNSVD